MSTPRASRRLGPAARVLAIPLVALTLVAGIWVTGGLSSDDCRAATGRTLAWWVAAALICGLIAWRRPELRAPVLGAYLVTAAVAGVYLGRSEVVDDRVEERVAVAPQPSAAERPMPQGGSSTRPANRLLSQGSCES